MLSCGSAGLIVLSTTVIFFSIEQAKIRKNLALGRLALLQNNNITRIANDLQVAKDDLQKEEDECVRRATDSILSGAQAGGDVHAVAGRGSEGP